MPKFHATKSTCSEEVDLPVIVISATYW